MAKKKEKEFHAGEMVIIMDKRTGIKIQGTVSTVESFEHLSESLRPTFRLKIFVSNGLEALSFDKETLEGKTFFGPCVLMHVKV